MAFGHRNRAGYHCRPVGQGRAMYHLVPDLIVATTAGMFHSWDEAGEQMLGIAAKELMNRTHRLSIPKEILRRVVLGRVLGECMAANHGG